jgi:hypothetical protein
VAARGRGPGELPTTLMVKFDESSGLQPGEEKRPT